MTEPESIADYQPTRDPYPGGEVATTAPRLLAYWTDVFDGSTQHVGEVVKIGLAQYVTASMGLTLPQQLLPGMTIMVLHNGNPEFISWSEARVSREYRPANPCPCAASRRPLLGGGHSCGS